MQPGPVPLSDVPDGTVLFDGVCVLCSRTFRFVAARDRAVRFRFTPVQGAYGRALAERIGIDPDRPESFAVVLGGVAHLRSSGGIRMLAGLPGWRWAAVLLVIPRPVRDGAYDLIARHRYRLFGRTETCMIPDAALARHILPGGG